VRLLFDQNLSHRLCNALAAEFPDAAHIRDFGLERADDEMLWRFAGENGYTIVSKDQDFHQRSFLFGHPPKVIWLRLGNCTTERVAQVLQGRLKEIAEFHKDSEASFLVLS
jgi:predicted nuclease of predicted toxin-antitoxin system